MKYIIFSIVIFFSTAGYSQTSHIYVKVIPPFFSSEDVTQSDFPNFINIKTLSFNIQRDEAISSGNQNNISRSYPGSLEIELGFGKSVMHLYEQMFTGALGRNLEIIYTKINPQSQNYSPHIYQTLKFDEFRVLSVEPSSFSNARVKLSFSKMHIENYRINSNGGLGASTDAGWNFISEISWF